jgi:serine/threonine protein kinase
LQRPGIVPVYDIGPMADDRPYFAMKLIQGRTLKELLSSRNAQREDARRFLSIFEPVCQTVGYAHSRGVIHRDLKPSNIMVGAFGEVQVVDWGLAKVMAGGARIESRTENLATKPPVATVRTEDTATGSSLTGTVMGTPPCMSPEQALGLTIRRCCIGSPRRPTSCSATMSLRNSAFGRRSPFGRMTRT